VPENLERDQIDLVTLAHCAASFQVIVSPP